MKRKILESVWLAVAGLALSAISVHAQSPAKPMLPLLESDPLPVGAELRLGTNRLRLADPAGYLIFSPDDRTLMVGSGSSVYFWETTSWKETWQTAADAFTCSPDGIHVAKKTGQNIIEIWDVAKRKLVHKRDLSRLAKSTFVFDLEFNVKGDALWVGIVNQGAWLYDWRQDKVLHRIDLPEIQPLGLPQSGDRTKIALRNQNGDIVIHDGTNGKLLREIHVNNEPQSGWLALNHDGTVLAVGRLGRKSMQFWETKDGKTIDLLPKAVLKELAARPNLKKRDDPNGPFTNAIDPPEIGDRCAFGPRSSLIVSNGSKMLAFDTATKKVIARAELPWSVLRSFILSHDGKSIALAYEDGFVEIRDSATLLPKVDDRHPRGAAQQVVFARDGQTLATFHNGKSAARVWSRRTGEQLHAFDIDGPIDFPEEFALAFLPDQRILTLGLNYRWNLTTGTREKQPERRERLVAVSDDGRRWLTVKENQMGDVASMAVVEAGTMREIIKLPLETTADMTVPSHSVRASFSANGGKVAVQASFMKNSVQDREIGTIEERVAVWSLEGAKAEAIFAQSFEGSAGRIGLSPDGQFLMMLGDYGSDSSERVWHLATGASIRKDSRDKKPAVPGARPVPLDRDEDLFPDTRGIGFGEVAAFSPDSQFLASSFEGGVAVRETLSGGTLLQLTGQRGHLCSLAFSPDGKSLASGTTDSTVVLWKVPTFGAAKPGEWKRDQADFLWNNLRGEPTIAYQAMANLHAGGDEAIAFFKDKIRLRSDEEDRLIQQSIADLAAPQFITREKATLRLEKWGARIMPFLADGLARPINLEQKRRLAAILDQCKNSGIDPDELRLGRSVYLLERIGTPAARVVLESLARGHALDLSAQSARAALSRLQKAG